jgi:hypothetical protein
LSDIGTPPPPGAGSSDCIIQVAHCGRFFAPAHRCPRRKPGAPGPGGRGPARSQSPRPDGSRVAESARLVCALARRVWLAGAVEPRLCLAAPVVPSGFVVRGTPRGQQDLPSADRASPSLPCDGPFPRLAMTAGFWPYIVARHATHPWFAPRGAEAYLWARAPATSLDLRDVGRSIPTYPCNLYRLLHLHGRSHRKPLHKTLARTWATATTRCALTRWPSQTSTVHDPDQRGSGLGTQPAPCSAGGGLGHGCSERPPRPTRLARCAGTGREACSVSVGGRLPQLEQASDARRRQLPHRTRPNRTSTRQGSGARSGPVTARPGPQDPQARSRHGPRLIRAIRF